MLGRIIAKITVHALRSKRLSADDKTECVTALLDNLQAIPIRNMVTFNQQGTIEIGGRTLEPEQAKAFAESARAMLDSFARKIIREQVTFDAVQMGVHQGLTPEMIVFAKAALWVMQEEQKLLERIIR
jgi:hypothetical protein